MVEWFTGSVTEAISAYQETKGVLIVYIHHSDEENDSNTKNFNDLWDKLGVELFSNIPGIAIRLVKDSDGAKQFAEFCQPLEVITAVEPLTEQRLKEAFRRGFKLYTDQLREQGIALSGTSVGGGTAGSMEGGAGEIRELTEEELQQKIQHAREKLELKRKTDAEKKEEEHRQKELLRRNEGKAFLDARERQKEREIMEAVEARRKEKENDAATLKKIREQIRQDKEDRQRKLTGGGGESSQKEAEPTPAQPIVQPSKPVEVDECRIQCKFPNGSTLVKTFPSKSPLQVVVDAVKEDGRHGSGSFLLVQAFPRRQLTEVDKTLLELSLTPSSALLVVPSDTKTRKRRRDVIINREDGYLSLLLGFLYTPLLGIVRFISSLFNFGVGNNANPAPVEGSKDERKKSKEAKESSSSRHTTREGNIGRLRDADSSDDNEGTWNGNSTQQL